MVFCFSWHAIRTLNFSVIIPNTVIDRFAILLEAWDFENVVTAHTGCCFVHAKQLAKELLLRTEPKLAELARRNANGEPVALTPGWSKNPDEICCG